MEAIKLFLELVEKISNFLHKRKQTKKELFENIAEPLYKELDALIDDYFLLFKNAHKLIDETPKNDVSMHLVELNESRETLWRARRKVEAFAQAVEESVKDEKFVSFSQQIVRLFQAPDHTDRGKMSKSIVVVGLLESLESGALDKNSAQEKLKVIESEVKASWVAVSQSYANLKLHVLS